MFGAFRHAVKVPLGVHVRLPCRVDSGVASSRACYKALRSALCAE